MARHSQPGRRDVELLDPGRTSRPQDGMQAVNGTLGPEISNLPDTEKLNQAGADWIAPAIRGVQGRLTWRAVLLVNRKS